MRSKLMVQKLPKSSKSCLMMRWLITFILTLSISLFVFFNGIAVAIQAGPSGTSSAIFYITDSSGFIGTPTPIQIEYSGTASPWVKQVELSNPFPIYDTSQNPPVFTGYSSIQFMGENVQISGTTPWTGWYEEILTPNWKFLNDGQNNISILGPNGVPPGLSITVDPVNGKYFQLNFDPIASPTTLCINFPLSYTAGLVAIPDFFEFKAYPIASTTPIPEPTTMLLLGLGLIGLAGIRRKIK